MGDEESVGSIRRAAEAVNSGDIEGYVDGFSPACLRWVAAVDHPFTLEEVAENMRLLALGFDRFRLEEEALFGAGDLVCARWRLRGTHTGDYLGIAATGRDIDVETCEVYQFDEGKVVAMWTYGDPAQLFRQITPPTAEAATP